MGIYYEKHELHINTKHTDTHNIQTYVYAGDNDGGWCYFDAIIYHSDPPAPSH